MVQTVQNTVRTCCCCSSARLSTLLLWRRGKSHGPAWFSGHKFPLKSARTDFRQSVSRTTPVIGSHVRAYLSSARRHRAPLKSGRTLRSHDLKSTDSRTEPKKYVKTCGKMGGCRSFWAWCSWVVFLPAPGLVGSFSSSLCFTFRATSQGPISSGIPSYNNHVRVHLFPTSILRTTALRFFFDGPWLRSAPRYQDKMYLGVQLPGYSVHTKLDTSPYIRVLARRSPLLSTIPGERPLS